MPADPDASRLAGVSGMRVSDPSIEHTSRAPAKTARQSWSRCPASTPASARSRSSSSGAGPAASRQVHATAGVGTRYRRCHGTSGRSPSSAVIASA